MFNKAINLHLFSITARLNQYATKAVSEQDPLEGLGGC